MVAKPPHVPHVLNTPQRIMLSSCNLIASCFVRSTSPSFLSFPTHIARKHVFSDPLPFSFSFPFFSFFVFFFFFSFFFFSCLAFIGHTCWNWHTRVPHCTYFGPISFQKKDIGQPNCTTEPENGHCVQHNDLGLYL